MDFVGTLKLAAQEVQFIWNECQMPARLKSKQHIQIHLNGLDPQLIEDSFVALSTYNDIHSTKKGNAEICMKNTTEVATFAATLKPRHWCYFGVASEKNVLERTFQQISKDDGTLEHRKWLTFSNVILYFQHVRPQHYHLDN